MILFNLDEKWQRWGKYSATIHLDFKEEFLNMNPLWDFVWFFQVKVIMGDDRERVGTLINIDDPDGIIKMDQNDQLKILPLKFLAKLGPTDLWAPPHKADVNCLSKSPLNLSKKRRWNFGLRYCSWLVLKHLRGKHN